MRLTGTRLALASGSLAVAVGLLAGCGTGGLVKQGDANNGKTLFVSKCGSCHTLAAAGTTGKVGPNLDDAFAADKSQGFKLSTIRIVVRSQIEIAQGAMPPNLVKGKDADDVATYVASVAGGPTTK
jgi:mono/diheme cytochrome c family protein